MISAASAKTQRLSLGLGGMVLSLASKSGITLTVGPAHKSFLNAEGKPDMFLEAEFGDVPHIKLDEELFHTEGVWSLYRSEDKLVFHFCTPERETTPHKIAVIGPDFKTGIIHTRIRETDQIGCFNPLNYPLDELLTIMLLARGKGILVHACAIDYKGQGWLFLGTSGAGKTTLSRILQSEPGVTLLSDDRIIIRDLKEGYSIYGTPWHGTAGVASPLSVPLTKILFLAHDKENRLTPLKRTDTVSRLLVRCFPTFWDQEGMSYTLSLCERLSAEVPSFELGFTPDKGVVEMLRNAI